MDKSEINVLFVKANRFLDKASVKKEKLKISNDTKSNQIAMGGMTSKPQPEKGLYMNKGELIQEQESDEGH